MHVQQMNIAYLLEYTEGSVSVKKKSKCSCTGYIHITLFLKYIIREHTENLIQASDKQIKDNNNHYPTYVHNHSE